MTDLANTDLALDARSTLAAARELLTAVTDLSERLHAHRYDVAEATMGNGEFLGLRADLRTDLTVLEGIARRLNRLGNLLDDQADAAFTFGQAQVRNMLDNITVRKIVTRGQSDYFVKLAVEAFKPSAGERVEVDRTAVEQAIFALVDDPEQRRLRERVTIAAVRQAVLAASEVSY